MGKSKNEDLLVSFVAYCNNNPEQRFWQALRNWSGQPFIIAAKGISWGVPPLVEGLEDTFYWENMNGISDRS